MSRENVRIASREAAGNPEMRFDPFDGKPINQNNPAELGHQFAFEYRDYEKVLNRLNIQRAERTEILNSRANERYVWQGQESNRSHEYECRDARLTRHNAFNDVRAFYGKEHAARTPLDEALDKAIADNRAHQAEVLAAAEKSGQTQSLVNEAVAQNLSAQPQNAAPPASETQGETEGQGESSSFSAGGNAGGASYGSGFSDTGGSSGGAGENGGNGESEGEGQSM